MAGWSAATWRQSRVVVGGDSSAASQWAASWTGVIRVRGNVVDGLAGGAVVIGPVDSFVVGGVGRRAGLGDVLVLGRGGVASRSRGGDAALGWSTVSWSEGNSEGDERSSIIGRPCPGIVTAREGGA